MPALGFALALVAAAFAVLVTMIVIAHKKEKNRPPVDDNPMITLDKWLDGPSEV